MLKLNKKQAIGTKTNAGEEKVVRREYRDGHKFFTAPEAKAMVEIITQEDKLRKKYYTHKIYTMRARNPLNGEHTPRYGDLPNVSEYDMEEKLETFDPGVPPAQEITYEKDRSKRQMERNKQLRKVRDSYDSKLEQLQLMYQQKSRDVEQSLLHNRLSGPV